MATLIQTGQIDRPSGNSFKASPTSNGGQDEDHYHSESTLGAAALICFLLMQLTKMPCHNLEIGILSVIGGLPETYAKQVPVCVYALEEVYA